MHVLDVPIRKIDEERRIVFGWANVPLPGSPLAKSVGEGSIEEFLSEIATAYRERFPSSETMGYSWIVETYPSYVIASREGLNGSGRTYLQHAYVVEGDSVAFGGGTEVEQVWVEKRLAEKRLSDPDAVDDRIKASLGKQLLEEAVAALAGKVDQQDDVVPLVELEKAAYAFVLSSGKGGVDHEVVEGPDGQLQKRGVGQIVESYFATYEKYERMGVPADVAKTLNQGWWVGFRVDDDDAWRGVKDGTYQMFSIGGTASRSELTV